MAPASFAALLRTGLRAAGRGAWGSSKRKYQSRKLATGQAGVWSSAFQAPIALHFFQATHEASLGVLGSHDGIIVGLGVVMNCGTQIFVHLLH